MSDVNIQLIAINNLSSYVDVLKLKRGCLTLTLLLQINCNWLLEIILLANRVYLISPGREFVIDKRGQSEDQYIFANVANRLKMHSIHITLYMYLFPLQCSTNECIAHVTHFIIVNQSHCSVNGARNVY